MKQFSCGDVVPGCAATWVRSSVDEILAEVAQHAEVAHGIAEVPPALVAQVRERILDVA
jgi:predicted small metal-binding protein